MKIYYLNNTTKRVYEEYGIQFKGQGYDFITRTSSRSIADLERKYYRDYDKFKHVIGTFEMQITKIGVL